MSRNDQHARMERVETALRDAERSDDGPAQAALRTLLKDLSPEQLALVAEEARRDEPGPAARLLDEVSRRAGRHVWPYSFDPVRPLAMPPEVAAVYLRDPGATTARVQCVDCRYQLPVSCPWPTRPPVRDEERPAGPCLICGEHALWHGRPRCGVTAHFEECPFCGGEVVAIDHRNTIVRKGDENGYWSPENA